MTLSRFFKAVALLVVLGGIVYWYAPARLAALVLMGRSPDCPFPQAIRAADGLRRQIQLKDEILAASREVEKDPAGYHLWETPKGRYWMPAGSDYVLPFNLAEQVRKIYGTGPTAVRSGDTVLDCGANVGVYTRDALEAGAKLVVAIEPAPENIECLNRNFQAEIAAGRVVVYPKGVWDKDDFLTLNVDPNNSAADSFLIQREGSHGVQKVPLTTIDKLVAELKLDRVDLIKMDIEGAEPNALRGARETLTRFKPRLTISAYHAPDHPRLIPETVKSMRADYKVECGPCAEIEWGVRPDILHFF
ncbi:MAG: FkbM family methyltransferase [Acidobacteria bacterium]|nr:FkbM family methyltransferase [Acidobacteriota bacterium]